MQHHRSIATVCLSGTLEDKLVAAAHAGFDGVEVFENDLIASPWSPARLRDRCAELGLSIVLYQPFRDFDSVDSGTRSANLRRASLKFDLMRELGTDTLLVCSSVSPDAVRDDRELVTQLRTLAERAGSCGVRVAYEALAWGVHVNTWDHSWRIVREVDHPALGLCLDSFHILSRGSDIEGIGDVPGDKLFFLQLADAPELGMDVLQWSRHHRLFPGQGAFDLPAFLGQVRRAGYAGPLSLEVFNDVFRQADPHRTAVDAMRSLLDLEEAHDADAVPTAPRLSGHAFADLSVDARTRPRVTAVLAGLGFAHAADHPSAPVELWRQGDATVLVTTESSRRGPRPGEPRFSVKHEAPTESAETAAGSDTAATSGAAFAEIGAVGVTSADPARSARRAQALLAPALPRSVPGGPAVAAPDGTAVVFCDDDWPEAFLRRSGTSAGAGLTGIDHVALAQPFDRFDEAALFHRSVLGLRLYEDSEYAAPFGLVRGRPMHAPDGGVRLMLTGTLLRRGEWSPAVPDPQHVAFATDDIFATARAIDVRPLPIPDNYYDDLAARVSLAPATLRRMRGHGVLHDHDEHGEFLHFYTDVVGSRVFFEVVQRIGGYRGFGARNAPVRMAAHYTARRAGRSG